MRTVALDPGRGGPPIVGLAPMPGELPVGVWRVDHAGSPPERHRAHAHNFPVLVYFEGAGGDLVTGGQVWTIAAGDVFVVAPGDVMGPFEAATPVHSAGWAVSFTADVLGRDDAGASPAWRTHPLLFPFVRGRASGALRLHVPPEARPEWTERITTLARELDERADGYREASLAHLTLLLVAVARLAADVVDDLRVNREPLLAEVFAVIERDYAHTLSLRDVARAVHISAGHLTTTVKRRTGRTVQEWIVDRRMTAARRLLAGSDLAIAEVGRRVGYPDAGYFARVFSRAHGTSPGRWRAAR